MAETQTKREREEAQVEEDTKRHKSYNQILSILDDEEDEPTQDLSEIFSTFQQELSNDLVDFDPLPKPNRDPDPCEDSVSIAVTVPSNYSGSTSDSQAAVLKEDDKERVIRHLLEASDDELGLPNKVDGGNEINGEDYSFAFCDGLWEIEGEAANYHALFHSDLFM